MKFYLARHTQTNYNVQGICNSDPSVDVHITELGVEQAQSLADQLADVDFDVIIVSELKRTHQTADIINEYHLKPLIVEKRLNDNNIGCEGQTDRQWKEALLASPDKWNMAINDGETLEQVRVRVREFLNDLRTKDYEAVLVVTHGWIIKLIHQILTNASFEETDAYDIKQGTYAVFEI